MPLKYKKNYHLDKLAKLLDADFSSKTPLLAYLNPDGVSRSWILISMICTPYIL